MSDSTTSPSPKNELLDLPVPSRIPSQFILPPPRSDLMDRLQAFLPQIKSANEQLEANPPTQQEGEDEVVVLEEMSSSDEDSSDEEEDSSEEDSSSDEEEAVVVLAPAVGEVPSMERLMDISKRPVVVKKSLVEGIVTLDDTEEPVKKAPGIVEMDTQ